MKRWRFHLLLTQWFVILPLFSIRKTYNKNTLQIGVGALVINDKNQVLAVSERNALIPGSWKLPGGYCEMKEDLVEAAIREVEEETNIKTRFESVVSGN